MINDTVINNIDVISDSLKKCFANHATFPEHVKTISEIGVIGYVVDLLQETASYEFIDGTKHVEKFSAIQQKDDTDFSAVDVKAAIVKVQNKLLDYSGFLNVIRAAGVVFYEVDIKQKKVVYTGANNAAHTEFFPVIK